MIGIGKIGIWLGSAKGPRGCGVPIWTDNGDGTVTISSGAPCPPPIWTDNGDGTVTITSSKEA